MANRYGLGAAQFQLTANDDQLLKTFAEGEAAARRWSAKIAQATKDAENAHNASAKGIIATIKSHNDALDANAKKAADVAKASQAQAQQLQNLASGFATTTLAAAGLSAGLAGLIQVSKEAVTQFQKVAQAQFEMQQTFKGAASDYEKFAQGLGKTTKFTTSEVQSSINAFGVLASNYNFTSSQIKTLTQLTTVYATKSGRDLEQSARDIQAAMRGEGEAVEKLNLTLGRDFVRNAGLMTAEQKKMFYTLTDQERAIIILNAAKKQSAEFDGVIAARMKSDLGTYDAFNKAVKELGITFGTGLNKPLQELLPLLTLAASITNTVAGSQKYLADEALKANIQIQQLIGNTKELARLQDYQSQSQGNGRAIVGGGGADAALTPEEIEKQEAALADSRKAREQQLQAAQTKTIAGLKERVKELEKEERQVQKTYEAAVDAENKRYQAVQASTALEQHRREEAAQATKDAALEAIKAEEDAFKEAHDRKMEMLRYEKEQKLKQLADTKDAAIEAAEEERDATVEAAENQIDSLNYQKEAQLDAIDAVRDATIKSLNEQKTARVDAIEEQIAHFQVMKESEQRAAEDAKETQIEAIDAQAQASADYYDQRIQEAEDVKDSVIDNAEEAKNASLRALEEESRARDQKRTAEDRQLEDRKKALEEARDAEDQAIEDSRNREIKALEDSKEAQLRILDETREATLEDIAERSKQTLRGIDDRKEAELRALEAVHTAQSRDIDAREKEELRAFNERANQIDQQYNEELRRTKQLTDERLDAIDDEKQALDSSHRHELQNIEDEKRARLDEIDSRIRALNSIESAFQGENRLADLGSELDIAKRRNDLTAIAKIEEQIRRERISQAYKTAEEALKTEKDSIATELDQRKAAAEERYRIQKEALEAEEELLKENLEANLEAIRARRDALKESLDAEKQAIQDRYDRERQILKDTYDAEKTLIADRYEAEKEAAVDRFEAEKELVQDRYEDEKRRIDDLSRKTIDGIKARYESQERGIAAARLLEDQELEEAKRRIDDRRKEEDNAAEDRKRQIEDTYNHEKERATDAYETTVGKLREQKEEAKRTFEAQKAAVDDAYDNEKRRIEDVYDNAETGIFAQLRKQKEAVEREYSARTATVNAAYDAEKTAIEDTYNGPNGLITKQKAAIEEARKQYDERKKHIEANYKAERDEIEATYSKPGTGLIPQQEAMAKDAASKYAARRAAVEAAYKAERAEIWEVYNNPVTGLIATQKKAHDDIIGNLNAQKKRWDDWQKDTLENIRKVINEPGGLNEFINKIKELEQKGYISPANPGAPGTTPGSGNPGPGGQGSSGQGGRSVGGGTNTVTGEPYSVLFPFDAPYPGGSAWEGGPPRHRGIDLQLPGRDGGAGKAVGAFRDGRVVSLTNESAGGTGVILQNPEDHLYEYYGHLNSRYVDRIGEEVKRGQAIGTLGRTGLNNQQNAHLHYEVRRLPDGDPVGQTIDPRPYMRGMTNTVGQGQGQGEILEFRPFGPNGPVVRIQATFADWFNKALKAAQQKHFSNPDLFARQMQHESAGFNPRVISGEKKSKAGAIGIAQFMPDTARALGVDPYNPGESLKAAAGYMHYLEDRYGGVRNALWAYNAGEGNFQSGVLHPETRRYLEILEPYRDGKLVMEPTLMMGLRTGEMGIAGETGQPERLLGVAATSAYDLGGSSGSQTLNMPINIGNEQLLKMTVQGLKLLVKSSRHVGLPGITIND